MPGAAGATSISAVKKERPVLEKIQLLRNVGQFGSVNGMPANLTKLTLLYAENGRGKTTLASILRSAATGIAAFIEDRHRLTAQHPAHVVLSETGGASAVFQNGSWTRTIPDVVVFDDQFVAENVCSGIEIDPAHRQNLHELILGAPGVSLNTTLQQHVTAIETHNRNLKSLPDALPPAIRGRFSVDAFCAVEPRDDIKAAIEEAGRGLAAAKAADSIRTRNGFQPIDAPAFDTGALQALLGRSLPDLEAQAASRVQAHIARLGSGGENWIGEGLPRILQEADGSETCPFCAQSLSGSSLIEHYRAYFSEAYADLKAAIVAIGQEVNKSHGGDALAAFERAVLVATQAHEFWGAFTPLPPVSIVTLDVARAWTTAREGVLAALRAKHLAPLEPSVLPAAVLAAVEDFERMRGEVAAASDALQASNEAIERIKEQTASANVVTLEADLENLRTIQRRHTRDVDAACRAYLDEKAAKAATEQARVAARAALDQYRSTVFPTYQTAINEYLRKLGAGYRVSNVESVNNRGGSSCNYSVVINDVGVSVTSASGPSFRNTLSAGDRNTLALAFFFASLEQDAANLGGKIIVIDDPMTSLDEHRNRNTLHEMRQLLARVDQMIVLSHSKPFLCPLWENAAPTLRSAFRIDRMRVNQNQDASTITLWDVHDDCITENDRRHEQARTYLTNGDPALERNVASSLRPILEQFMRVAYPEAFPPGTLLGPFIGACERFRGTAGQLLSAADIVELRRLLDYANDFHHDSNPAWQTAVINGQELTDFCEKTLAFARRA